MFWAFRKSKWAAAGVFAAAVALTVLIWVRRINDPVYIPAVASALMLALGVLLGRLVGNLVANSQNVKCLSRLHVDLDPAAFLEVYEPVAARLPVGSTDYAAARSYLADARAALGDFDGAIATLSPPEEWKKPSAALTGVYWQKLCSYHIFKGDRKEAQRALGELDALLASPGTGAELGKNLKESRRLLQNRLAVLGNKQVERDWLAGRVETAPYKLLRLELLQTLAQLALREGDTEAARAYLEELKADGGKTFFPRWAAQRLPEQ